MEEYEIDPIKRSSRKWKKSFRDKSRGSKEATAKKKKKRQILSLEKAMNCTERNIHGI